VFNRTFQARRGDLVSAGEVLQELVERAAERQHFYRPERRPRPGCPRPQGRKKPGPPLQGTQLSLNFADPDKPLADIFPEAYPD
jgi:hypothetical protein